MIHSQLRDDTRDYWINTSIPYLNNPTPLEFLKAQLTYHPFIIRGIVPNWKAYERWTLDYINEKVVDNYITVNITPDGLADSIKPATYGTLTSPEGVEIEEVFTYPAEVKMACDEFVDMIVNPMLGDAVPYLSQQDDNFRKQPAYEHLRDDIPLSIQLMNETSDHALEAVNIWIGDERSISSLHKDHYENLYAVISGEKTFTLLPPTDVAFLPMKAIYTISYKLCEGSSQQRPQLRDMILDEASISADDSFRWINIDPDDPHAHIMYPSYAYASPIRCKVVAGEMLFIPSMWYHRVSQTCPTIAVNYWYEQNFNFRYVMYNMASNLSITQAIDNDEDEVVESEAII